MILGEFITAFRTLTLIPLPGKEVENQANSLVFFPVVGAFIGGLVTLVTWLVGGLWEWESGAGVAGVIVATWVTGGLHLDGLADAVDGLYGGETRERMLDIMKDTRLGAFGVIAIVLSLLVKTVSLSQMAFLSQWRWIPVPFICSRMILVLLPVILPYARSEGGTAQNIVENAKTRHFIIATMLCLLGCIALTGAAGALVFVLSLVLGYGNARWMKRTFGGTTGDLLGMSNELVECVLFFTIAIIMTALNGLSGTQWSLDFLAGW